MIGFGIAGLIVAFIVFAELHSIREIPQSAFQKMLNMKAPKL